MSDEVAKEIAEAFIAEQQNDFRYEFIGVRKVDRFPNELNVSFSVTSSAGVEFEGPVVVVVDEQTRSARFF